MKNYTKLELPLDHSVIRSFGHSVIASDHSVIGKSRSGFTIVELLIVIAILGILIGLVSVAIGGSLRNGRTKRAEAMCRVLQQSIAMYYTKVGEWPSAIESKANSMSGDSDTYVFSPDETDQIFQEIVKKSTGSGATMSLVDASALFVANKSKLKMNGEGCYDNHSAKTLNSYCGDQACANGTDFSRACRQGKGHIPLTSMAFGYQTTKSGKFARFWITYNAKTDSVTVSRKNPKRTYPQDWN